MALDLVRLGQLLQKIERKEFPGPLQRGKVAPLVSWNFLLKDHWV